MIISNGKKKTFCVCFLLLKFSVVWGGRQKFSFFYFYLTTFTKEDDFRFLFGEGERRDER
jgi:hypothetical protein